MEAKRASDRIDDLKAAGASRVVALLKEEIGTEVADFQKYWAQEVFRDGDKAFFKSLGGGKVNEPVGLKGFLAMLANPFSKSRTKLHLANIKKEKDVAQNLTGEGFITGGVYVIRQDGKASYAFLEEEIGDYAPIDDVVEAVKAAAKGEDYTLAPLAFPGAANEGPARKTWKEWAVRSSGPDGYCFGDGAKGIAASLLRARGK